jgi:hypothetical protein
MGQTLQAGVAPGLALAGLLAVAGIAAARFGGSLPHVGIGAVGVAVAASAGRLATAPTAVLAVVLIAGGAALGLAACAVDERARRPARPLWPPPLLPDVAVLGLAVGAGAILRPALTVDLPAGPLGGFPPLTEGVVGLIVGLAGAAVIAHRGVRQRPAPLTWAVVGAVTAVVAVLGSGALALRAQAIAPVFAVVDIAGLGLRAAAVGVVARYGAVWGVAAAVLLGVGEALLTHSLTGAHVGLLPAVAVLGVGVWDAGRRAGAGAGVEAA